MKTSLLPHDLTPDGYRPPSVLLVFLLALLGVDSAALFGQTAPDKPAGEEVIVLSPFEVKASSDAGYQATETLAGSRLKSQLKDVATQVTVMTPEFLQDLAITNLDEAMRYSLNTETDAETIEVTAPGNAGISATTRPFTGGGRTRGLGASNKAHDFFDTFVPIDSYNTERFTFSSGPNSILFGNANPAGTIDTTFKRAQLNRSKFSVGYRIDDRGSHRVSVDLNQPLVKNRLGLRIATLTDRQHDPLEPAFSNQDRLFASLVFKPFKKLTLRAYHETSTLFAHPTRNTLVQDHVTPWILAGKPAFNNGGGLTAPFPAIPAGSLFTRRIVTRPYYTMNSAAPDVVPAVDLWGNTVVTNGFDVITANAADKFQHSVIAGSLYPLDLSFSGNANQAKSNAWIRGAVAELNPIKNLFLEAGFNQERFKQKAVDLFTNSEAALYVDANLYLNDRVTPNPDFGRYFFENDTPLNSKNYGWKEQKRLSVSYELNLTERPGWVRWLGRHQIAALADQLETFTLNGRGDYRVVGDYPFTTTNAITRIINFRYYIDPRHPTIQMPFDPLASGIFTLPGSNVNIGGWDPTLVPQQGSPQNVPAIPETARSLVDSRVLTLQSFFLKDRISVLLGERRDHVKNQNSPDLPASYDFEGTATGDIPWSTITSQTPHTRLKSVVVHPLPWLSASYVESNSQQVPTTIIRNIDGTLAPQNNGTGKEYSVTLRWSDRLSLRLSKYEDSAVGVLSSQRSPRPTPTTPTAGKGNIIRNDVANLENTVRLLGAPLSQTYAYYDDELARQAATTSGGNAGATFQNVFDLLADRQAEGYEATLIGNPTPNWRLSISAAKNQTRETNIGPQYFAFIKERIPVWSDPAYLDQPVKATPTITMRQLLAASLQSWNYIRQADGTLNGQERKYRVTATTRYSFAQGRLKGAFLGANYIWRSPAAVGYLTKTITDNEFVIPGVTTGALTVADLSRPIRGGALTSFDAFLGYNRRLFQKKINWSVQLNVRNVLDDHDLLVQRALSTGEGALFTAQEPRSFILTNTFEF